MNPELARAKPRYSSIPNMNTEETEEGRTKAYICKYRTLFLHNSLSLLYDPTTFLIYLSVRMPSPPPT